MHSPHQKYLVKQELWQFRVPPFGLSTAPYTFTKLIKPVVSCLRRLETRTILYLDDMLIMHQSRELLLEQLAAALRLLTAVGFLLNLKKSVLTPSKPDGVPGVSHRLHQDGDIPHQAGQEHGSVGNCIPEGPCTNPGDHGGSPPSSASSPSPLPVPRENQIGGWP